MRSAPPSQISCVHGAADMKNCIPRVLPFLGDDQSSAGVVSDPIHAKRGASRRFIPSQFPAVLTVASCERVVGATAAPRLGRLEPARHLQSELEAADADGVDNDAGARNGHHQRPRSRRIVTSEAAPIA
jgi:hypothetical protein